MPLEPIAIVGMACRLPGGVSNPKEFWELLVNGQTGYTDFPPDRVNIDAWHHPDATQPGSFVTKGGYFLDHDLHDFDNDFFGISAVEASTMDPAQKQLLEVAYEACDGAGVSREQLAGSMTGVYVGNFCPEQCLAGLKDVEAMTPYTATGASTAMLSNRLNYALDLKGPSLTVDTACASSAYALHMACAGLRVRDCDAALVCAANTIRSVEAQMFMSKLGALSPTSRCHTFDASADGYARADGIVAVYVMRLSDAVRSGRPIRAVIRGTAIGANGSGESLTKPSGTAQAAVIRKAYDDAGITDLGSTGYFECHGTGTPIGDRIETRAVADVFATHRSAGDPLLIGSVKTNVGHSGGAAGLTALIKAVLAIETKTIPPTIGIQNLNPNIDFDEWKIKVVQSPTPWPETVPIRRASLNSFGFGGANAHIVIEEANSAVEEFIQSQANSADHLVIPGPPNIKSISPSRSRASFTPGDEQSDTTPLSDVSDSISNETTLVVCSANSETSLSRTIDAIRWGLETYSSRDIAKTLTHRSRLHHRAYAICDGIHEPSFQCGVECQDLQLGFVFTGGGAQWPNMGRQLLQFPAFRNSIRRTDDYVATLPDPPSWTVEGMMQADVSSPEMDEPRVAQYMTPALEIALVDLLADWGIRPSMVTGHSAGEVAAAYAAGYLTHDEAAAVAYYRGKTTSEAVMMPGAMLAVGLSAARCQQLIPDGAHVVVGAVNSPESVTLSGDRDAIAAIKSRCDNENVFNRFIASKGVAYHSALIKPAAEAYSNLLAALPKLSEKPKIKAKWYSTLTGALYTEDTLPIMYWRENMESPVLFAPAVAAMRAAGITHLVEIGPHSTLRSPISEIIKPIASDKPFSYSVAVKRNDDAVSVILNMCGELSLAGVGVDVSRVNGGSGVHLSDFLTYPWDHQAISQESRANREWRLRKYPRHELLGSLVPGLALNTKMWRNVISPNRIPWLNDYRLGEDSIFPASGFVCMAIEALRQSCEPSEDGCIVIDDFTIGTVLLVNNDVETFLTMRRLPLGSNTTSTVVWDFNISSVQDGISKQHCQGCIYNSVQPLLVGESQLNLGASPLESISVPSISWYNDLASKRGIFLGERFRRMDSIVFERRCNHAAAYVDLKAASRPMMRSAQANLVLNPTVLESCFTLPILAAGPSRRDQPYLPVSVDRIAISNEIFRGGRVRLSAQAEYLGMRGLQASCSMGIAEKTTMTIQGLRFSGLSRPDNSQRHQERSPFWRLTWVDDYHGITKENESLYFPPGKYWPELYKYPRHRRVYLAQMWAVQFAQQYPDLLFRGPVSDQHKYFIEWINWFLEITVKEHPEMCSMSLQERHSAIESERPVSDPGIGLSWAIYDNMRELIEGTRSALDVVTQNGLLSHFYETQLPYNKFERVVEMMGLRNPSMRILEIGAGTGSATRCVLRSLTQGSTQQYSSYTFTDISSSFFEAAAATFVEYPDIEYKVYNMENSPEDQGIDPASYDLVLASCAVHVTPNIVGALQSIRKLLRPGGTLLLFEITAEHHDLNFALGLLPGFYSGYDEGRKRHPFLSTEQWAEALPQADFTTPELSVNDVPEDWHAFTVLAATAVEPGSQRDYTRGHIMIVSRDKPTALANLIEDLARRQGASVIHKSLMSLGENETEVEMSASRLIFLAGLDQAADTGAEDVDDPTITNRVALILQQADSLLWVTQRGLMRGDQTAGSRLHERVAQCAARAGVQVASMDFEAVVNRDEAMAGEILRRQALLPRSEDTEFRQLEGRWLIPRLLPDQRLTQAFAGAQGLGATTSRTVLGESGPLRLSTKGDGSLDALAFEKNTDVDGALPPGHLEIKVRAAGMNMIDFLGLTASQGTDCVSSEFAGIVTATADDVVDFSAGEAVFGLWPGRFENVTRVPASVCQRMRPGDAFEAAATLPLAYCTAWQAVVEAGRTQPGDHILIQSASGGVGMAAIAVARSIGAEVYATAGSATKQAALHDLGIPECRTFSSSDDAEEAVMRRATGGRGFDVVLNTSSGDYLRAVSWPVIAPFGRFIELRTSASLAAESGIWNLKKISEGVGIIPVDISRLCAQKPGAVASAMRAIGARYRSSALAALPHRSFPIAQLGMAYSEFSRFEHTGKLVLSYGDGDSVPYWPVAEAPRLHHDGRYMLIGAVGDLMIHIARWMVQNGARHLIFVGPHPLAQDDHAGFFNELMAAGVTAEQLEGNASSMNDVRQAVSAVGTLPLRGVIHVAMKLQEPPGSVGERHVDEEGAKDQQAAVLEDLYSAITHGNLDLDFLASIGTTKGPANGPDLDDLCRFQRIQGLPSASVNIVPTQITYEILELVCTALSDISARAARQAQEPIYILPDAGAGSSSDPPSISQQKDARWALAKSQDNMLKRRAASLQPRPAATAAGTTSFVDNIQSQVIGRLSKLLWIPHERLQTDVSLDVVSIDSMIATEFLSWIQQTFDASISMVELLSEGMTIEKLVKVLCGKDKL
ncbi:polyketide synthase [Xylaria palmicola]|nr:polyketide synthase [Xylaria palmicola]